MVVVYGAAPVRSGLVFFFDPLNARSYPGTGTICYDLTGNAAAGETVNSPAFNQTGFFSFATNNLIRFPNTVLLDNQAFSVEVWVRTNSTNQNGFWFEKGVVNSQYSLFQEGTVIRCRINNGTGIVNTISVTSANFMNTTNWYQVIFTFTSGSQVCYINGTVAGTGSTVATVATNGGGMSLGAYGGFSGSRGYYYNGDLSICRVYNRVLDQTEVLQNLNSIRGRYGI